MFKRISLALLCAILLTGCASNGTESEVTSTSEPTPEELGFERVESLEVTTTCGFYYKDFLKLGATAASDISMDNPDWEFTEEGTKVSWEYDNGSAEMISYWRDEAEGLSCFTKTFPINTANINSWINVELVGIDNLLGTVHERSSMQGVTWYYEWNTDLESCKLQVYSTGTTGKYTGLVSFTRSGPTSYDQVMPEQPEVTE